MITVMDLEPGTKIVKRRGAWWLVWKNHNHAANSFMDAIAEVVRQQRKGR